MKLIAIFLAILFLESTTQIAWAQANPVTGTTVVKANDMTWVYITPVCKFGLQFIVSTQDKRSSGAASAGLVLIQVLGKDGKPMLCTEGIK
jgi:hypothetical protein